jgi:guanidinopropionase
MGSFCRWSGRPTTASHTKCRPARSSGIIARRLRQLQGATQLLGGRPFSHDQGMRVVSIEEFHDKGWRWADEEARVIVDEGPAYFSFDIDALDTTYA